MPASNLLRTQPTDVWRGDPVTSLTIDLGAANDVRMAALLYSNATADALWRVRAAASQAALTSGAAYDSGWLPHYPVPVGDTPPADLDGWDRTHAFLWMAAVQSFRWWRIDIDDATNPAGFYQAGRLYLANPWQPTLNRRYGGAFGSVDETTVQRSRGGQTYANRGPRRREWSLPMQYGSAAELHADARRFQRAVGTDGDCLIVLDPEDRTALMETMIYARLTGSRQVAESSFRFWEQTVAAEEWELP